MPRKLHIVLQLTCEFCKETSFIESFINGIYMYVCMYIFRESASGGEAQRERERIFSRLHTQCREWHLFLKVTVGAPGWLSWLSIRLWLRS